MDTTTTIRFVRRPLHLSLLEVKIAAKSDHQHENDRRERERDRDRRRSPTPETEEGEEGEIPEDPVEPESPRPRTPSISPPKLSPPKPFVNSISIDPINYPRGFPSVPASNEDLNGDSTQMEAGDRDEDEDALHDNQMDEGQTYDLPPSSQSSSTDAYRPPKLLMRNRPNAPPPPIHTTQTPPAPPADTPPMPPPEFTPPPPPPSDSNTPLGPSTTVNGAPIANRNPYLSNKHLDHVKGRKDTPGRVYEKDEPPQAPNPNLRQPSTRPPSPRSGAGMAKKAGTAGETPIGHLPGTYRRRNKQEELDAFNRSFEGSTTLDAYDVGLKLGEGTFG